MSDKKLIIFFICFFLVATGFKYVNSKKALQGPVLTPLEKNYVEPVKVSKKIVEKKIMVHLAGAVNEPGVYHVVKGKRVLEFINESGGLKPGANLDKVKLAARLKDGQTVHIPYKKNIQQAKQPSSNKKSISIININQATVNELTQLPGIGPKIAERIINYRIKNHLFNSCEEIQQVKGIGPKLYKKIAAYLTI